MGLCFSRAQEQQQIKTWSWTTTLLMTFLQVMLEDSRAPEMTWLLDAPNNSKHNVAKMKANVAIKFVLKEDAYCQDRQVS